MVAEAARLVYVDASALVKLIVREAESDALIAFLGGAGRQVSSRIVTVEVSRAIARRIVQAANDLVGHVLGALYLIEVDATVTHTAASLEPATLRTLDAIHIASALEVSTEIESFITYDARQAEAAKSAGLRVVAPS